MTILVLAEHDNTSLRLATLRTMGAASLIATFSGIDVHVLVAGRAVADVGDAATRIAGVSKVLVLDVFNAENATAEIGAAVMKIAHRYSHILAPATVSGNMLASHIAATLQVEQFSAITAVTGADAFEQKVNGAEVSAKPKSKAGLRVITVCTSRFDTVATEGGGAELTQIGELELMASRAYPQAWAKLGAGGCDAAVRPFSTNYGSALRAMSERLDSAMLGLRAMHHRFGIAADCVADDLWQISLDGCETV
jgi:electron transfer flavoprotein alpha subunit